MNLSNKNQGLLKRIIHIVGSNNVLHKQKDLHIYSQTLLPVEIYPLCVVHPHTKNEISDLVKLFAQEHIPYHVISTGKNWGYSDALTPKHNMVLISLQKMNSIHELNKELGYVVIEPGVTQKQLHTFLSKEAPHLCMDVTGSSEDTSIVGNVLQRGFGHSLYGDKYAHSCNYEVVLKNGDITHATFGNFPTSKVSNVYKWGVGPSLEGLFMQSNYGIVTKMTLWLFPKPEHLEVVYFGLKYKHSIGSFAEKIKYLRLEKTITSTVHISNDLRVLSLLEQFPSEASLLSKEKKKALVKKYNLSAWVGSIGVYGTHAQVKANIKRIKEVLKNEDINIYITLSRKKIYLLETLKKILGTINIPIRFHPLYKNALTAFNLLQGVPIRSVTKSLLWRKKRLPKNTHLDSINPVELETGLLWISPLIPATKNDIERALMLLEKSFSQHSFDFMTTLSSLNERVFCAVSSIHFNKENKEEVIRAQKCYKETIDTLIQHGYIPYRFGHLSDDIVEKMNRKVYEL